MKEYRVKYIENILEDKTEYRKNQFSEGSDYGTMTCINASFDNYFNANGLSEQQLKSLLFEKDGNGNVEVIIEYYPSVPVTQFITIVEDSFDDALEIFRDTYPYEEILKVELVEDDE